MLECLCGHVFFSVMRICGLWRRDIPHHKLHQLACMFDFTRFKEHDVRCVEVTFTCGVVAILFLSSCVAIVFVM